MEIIKFPLSNSRSWFCSKIIFFKTSKHWLFKLVLLIFKKLNTKMINHSIHDYQNWFSAIKSCFFNKYWKSDNWRVTIILQSKRCQASIFTAKSSLLLKSSFYLWILNMAVNNLVWIHTCRVYDARKKEKDEKILILVEFLLIWHSQTFFWGE